MAKSLTIALVTLLLAACGGASSSHAIPRPTGGVLPPAHAQSPSPGTVSITWTAPTTNTDGSAITGTLSYDVYEMKPCVSTADCAGEVSAGQTMGTVAKQVTTENAQVSNVPDGLHCYTVQTQEVLPDGANVASALAAMNPATDGTGSCTNVTGSTTPNPNPQSASNVKVTGS